MRCPRRWFSFSLRTMFIVVTALCCYLAWEMSIVRQRQSLLAELRTKPGAQITTAETWLQFLSPGPAAPKMASIPRVRVWLGDEAIQSIGLARGFHQLNQERVVELKRAFPEANVYEYELPLEPCHPGCFPRGTLVETPEGPRPIERIAIGDELTAFRADGTPIVVHVQSVFVTKNRVWQVETADGSLLTTETQPLAKCGPPLRGRTSDVEGRGVAESLSGRGATDSIFHPVRAGDLQPGDQILRYENGQLRRTRVLSVTPTDRIERVFNLVLGDRELFIAGGFLSRSKPPED